MVMAMVGSAFADAAPEPGYKRVGVPLNIKPEADFSEYRFFLDSPTVIEEIELSKDKTTTVSDADRGGVMKFTSLIAIPKSSLADYAAPIAREKLEALHAAVNQKKIDGVIELVSHNFDSYVKIREAKKFKAPLYVLKPHAEKKIEAVETKSATGGKKTSEIIGDDEKGSNLAMIVAGGLMSLALVFGGVWFIRRQKRA